MKYQVGDRVLLLHSGEEGNVVDIINDKMMIVDVGGVNFPVYMDQVDFPYFKRFSEKKLFPEKKEKKYVDDLRKEKKDLAGRKEDGVWLGFLPVMEADEFGDEVVEELKIHLVNQTNTAYQFRYRLNYFGKEEFSLNNLLQPFEDFYLHDVLFSDMNDSPAFVFEFSLVQPQKNKAPMIEAMVKLKPRQLFTSIEDLRKKNQATFSYRLFDQYPDKLKEEGLEWDKGGYPGQRPYDAKKARQFLEPARSVVDLHIEKLSNDWKHLGNYEIMGIQLKAFEKYFDLAVAHLQPSLIVIHGVGEGRLRDEIHDRLHHRKEVKSFVNQYDPRYGFGATEIYFQY